MIDRPISNIEYKYINRVVDRVVVLLPTVSRHDCMRALHAVHSNGCPLDLSQLLAFDDFNFLHDIVGIYRHLDRKSGELRDCFVPRCASH